MKRVVAHMVWSTTIEIDVPDDMHNEDITDCLKIRADQDMNTGHVYGPCVHECDTNPDLVE